MVVAKFRDFHELCYFEPFTKFNKKIKITGHIIAEYIYVENEERDRLAKQKHEYLIEQVQYNGRLVINKDDLIDGVLKERLFFENPCKELIWVLQKINYINGSELNGERKYYNYSFDFNTESRNPGASIKIEFNSRDREAYKKSIFFDKIYPYSRHYSTPSDGINCYSFSLRPELSTPNGSANLSKLDDVVLNIMPILPAITDMIENNTKYRWAIYAPSYNILRIFSGLAGLLFFK